MLGAEGVSSALHAVPTTGSAAASGGSAEAAAAAAAAVSEAAAASFSHPSHLLGTSNPAADALATLRAFCAGSFPPVPDVEEHEGEGEEGGEDGGRDGLGHSSLLAVSADARAAKERLQREQEEWDGAISLLDPIIPHPLQAAHAYYKRLLARKLHRWWKLLSYQAERRSIGLVNGWYPDCAAISQPFSLRAAVEACAGNLDERGQQREGGVMPAGLSTACARVMSTCSPLPGWKEASFYLKGHAQLIAIGLTVIGAAIYLPVIVLWRAKAWPGGRLAWMAGVAACYGAVWGWLETLH